MTFRRLFVVALLGLVGAGCASAPTARVAGPSQDRGLSIALIGQRCDRENDPSWSVADILDLALRVAVANRSDAPVQFDPLALQLIAAGENRAPHRADDADLVMPGSTRVFEVRFLERDDRLACNVPMTLTLAGFAPIPFLASRDDI
jgi:hypothetical protein